MNQKIEKLFEEINSEYEPMSMGGLTILGDHIEYGEWDEENYKETLKRLLDIFINKNTSIDHQRTLNRIIILLIGQNYYDFTFEDFKPLITVLERGTDYDKMDVSLYMIAHTFDPKFLPLVEKFTNHPEKNVREQAIETKNWIKKKMA